MSEFILVTTYFKEENIFVGNKKLFTNASHSGHKLYGKNIVILRKKRNYQGYYLNSNWISSIVG